MSGWALYQWDNIPSPIPVEQFTQSQYNLFKSVVKTFLVSGKSFTRIGKKLTASYNFDRINNFLYLHIYMILIREQLLEDVAVTLTVKTYDEIAEEYKFDCIQKKLGCSSQQFRAYVRPFIEDFIAQESGGIDFMSLDENYMNPFYILP